MYADLKQALLREYSYSRWVQTRKHTVAGKEGVAVFSRYPIEAATPFCLQEGVNAGSVVINHPKTRIQVISVRTD
jgi:hypothetical protein